MNDLKDYLVAFSIIVKSVNGIATNEHLLIECKQTNTADIMIRRYKHVEKTDLILFYIKVALEKQMTTTRRNFNNRGIVWWVSPIKF